MRNLKKFLALVLAMMMAFSLMITVNAADVEVKTDAPVTAEYKTAVNILFQLGVLKGSGDDGLYHPNSTITRAEFAMMLFRLHSGKVDDAEATKYTQYSSVFDDVPAGYWAAGAIGYCYLNKLMVGVSDSSFNPTGEIDTTSVFISLLRAVGYGQNKEYEGNNWSINALKDARLYNLDAHLINTDRDYSAPATRQAVAELFFTTLTEITPVDYKIETGGYVTGSDGKDANDTHNVVTLGELQFKMVSVKYEQGMSGLTKAGYKGESPFVGDKFGRNPPVSVLLIGGEIAYYEYAAPDYTLYGQVKEQDLYKTVGSNRADAGATYPYSWTVYNDGANNTISAAKAAGANGHPGATESNAYNDTAVGSVTEIYVTDNATGGNILVVTYNTYIGTVSRVTAAKGGVDRYITIRNESDNFNGNAALNVTTESFKKDDVVLYTYSKMGTPQAGIQTVQLAPTVTGTLKRVVNGQTFTVNGQEYKHSNTAKSKAALTDASLDKEVTFYIDTQDNIMMVAADGATAAAANYIYVLAHSAGVNDPDYIATAGASFTAEVYGVTPDGSYTTYTIKASGSASENGWDEKNQAANLGLYTYTVNKDGSLKLSKPINVHPDNKIKAKDTAVEATVGDIHGTYLLTGKTAYVYIEVKEWGKDQTVKTVTPMVGNLTLGVELNTSDTFLGVNDDGVVEVVYFIKGYVDPNVTAATGEYVLVDTGTEKKVQDADEGNWVQYDAWTSDGTKITVTFEVGSDKQTLKDKSSLHHQVTLDNTTKNYVVCELNDDDSVSIVKDEASEGSLKVVYASGLVDKYEDDIMSVALSGDSKTANTAAGLDASYHNLRVSDDTNWAVIGDLDIGTLVKGASVIYVKGTSLAKNQYEALAIWIVNNPGEATIGNVTFDDASVSQLGTGATTTDIEVDEETLVTGSGVKNYVHVNITIEMTPGDSGSATAGELANFKNVIIDEVTASHCENVETDGIKFAVTQTKTGVGTDGTGGKLTIKFTVTVIITGANDNIDDLVIKFHHDG